VRIRFRAPYPEHARLQPVAVPARASVPGGSTDNWTLVDLAAALNANIEKLNARLFTHLDYAAVATRP
jgi:hypothetical protein